MNGIGPIRRMLWHLAGISVDEARRNKHRLDWRIYDTWGFLILATMTMGAVSGYHLGVAAWKSAFAGVITGVVNAAFIGAIDRSLISGLWGHKLREDAGYGILIVRTVFATLVGSFFALLLLLMLLDKDLEAPLGDILAAKKVAAFGKLRSEHTAGIVNLTERRSDLASRIATASNQAKAARDAAVAESDGTGGSGNEGARGLYRIKEAVAIARETEAGAVRAALGPRLAAIDAELIEADTRLAQARLDAAARIDNASGLLDKSEALFTLVKTSMGARVWVLAVLIMLIFYDIVPVLSKLQHPITTYDAIVASRRRRNERNVKLDGSLHRIEARSRVAIAEILAAELRQTVTRIFAMGAGQSKQTENEMQTQAQNWIGKRVRHATGASDNESREKTA